MGTHGRSKEMVVSGSKLTLRQADFRDTSFCYELMSHNMKELFNRNLEEKWSRKKFVGGFDLKRIKIIEHKGMSVGFFDCEMIGDKLYWHNIQISEDYQNGVGTKTVKLIEQMARNNYIEIIFGKVFCENLKIINWLQKFGYKIDEKIEKENSYWVKKKLDMAK